MKHIGLFEGIGGFSLAANWMKWETVAWCEWNKKCQLLLSKRFPKAKQHGNITTTDFSIYRGQCDIVTGGFPCQPYSVAGARKGKEDERHLWPEMLRAIREIQPTWIVGENVAGLLNWNKGMVLHEIKTDLESEGFEVFPPCILPACGVNANHKRDRLWIIAYSAGNGHSRGNGLRQDTRTQGTNKSEENKREWVWNDINGNEPKGIITDTDTCRQQECGQEWFTPIQFAQDNRFTSEPGICRGVDGLPNRVDRLKQLGNAIVPQVALQIFKAIAQLSEQNAEYGTESVANPLL